jgi:hypothetical protein
LLQLLPLSYLQKPFPQQPLLQYLKQPWPLLRLDLQQPSLQRQRMLHYTLVRVQALEQVVPQVLVQERVELM